MTVIRADVAGLLREGQSVAAIARRLHVDPRIIRETRDVLGLPKARPGVAAAASVEDAFWARAVVLDGGHVGWDGCVTEGRAVLRHMGRMHSACRVAFRICYGRDAKGRVRSACDVPGCVAPRCMEDQPMRDKYTLIFGGAW